MDDLERGFLRAIHDDPEDTVSPLVYADWLEERHHPGDWEHAEFIRVQCALEQLPPEDKRRPAYEKREQELLAGNREAWEAPLRKHGVTDVCFRRGVPDSVTMSAADFLKEASNIFAVAPTITAASITYLYSFEHPKTQQEHVDNFVQGRIPSGNTGARLLAELPQLQQLFRLSLTGNHIGVEGATVLANSPWLKNLTALDFFANWLQPAGVAAVVRSPYLHRVVDLNLGRNQLGNTGLQILLESPILDRVTRLNLAGNQLGDNEVIALARASRLAHLTELDLGFNQITDDGARTLAASPYLSNLEALNLELNTLSRAGASALATSPHLPKLVALNLFDNILQYNDNGRIRREPGDVQRRNQRDLDRIASTVADRKRRRGDYTCGEVPPR